LRAKLLHIATLLAICLCVSAQGGKTGKMSSMLKRMAYQNAHLNATRSTVGSKQKEVLALVKCTNPDVLEREGCRTVYNWGDIYATSIPLGKLSRLSAYDEVKRIEASRPCDICVDTTSVLLGVNDVRQGVDGIPGLTGKGVVMGIQDVGFDLTHPTFYSRDLKEYRIKAFWDMLDPDTLESTL